MMGWIGRAGEWFLQRDELGAARKLRNESSAWQKTCQRRAKACLFLADFLRDSPRFPGDILPEIVDLYRSACAWLLAAAATAPRPLATVLEETAQARLLQVAGQQAAADAVRTVLLRTPVEDATLDSRQLEADAQLLHTFVHSARRFWDGAYAVQWAWWRRSARLMLFAPGLVLIGLVVAASWNAVADHFPKGTKLEVVAWQASSSYANCDLSNHQCGGKPVNIFFHTVEEDSPWVEFDLGSAKPISRVEIQNIKDVMYQDRAVPLLVEVSNDRSDWIKMAQRDTVFDSWTAQFPTTIARYVRLRVARRTYFHLESVSIR